MPPADGWHHCQVAACQLLTPNPLQQLCRPVTTQDPDLFRDELERFYCQTWICAGRANQIPAPATIFCARSRVKASSLRGIASNSLRAFSTSAGIVVPVSAPSPKDIFPGRIQSGYHGWTYGPTGISSAPHTHTTASVAKIIPSIAFNAEVWDGHIFIQPRSEPAPLAGQLEDLTQKFLHWQMADLRTYRRIGYEVKATGS